MEPNIENFGRKCTNLNIRKQNATNENVKTLAVNYGDCPHGYMEQHVYLWIFCRPKAKIKVGFTKSYIIK